MPPEPTTDPDAPATGTDGDDPQGTDALGDAGKKALDAMKAKLKAAEAKVKELSPLANEAQRLKAAQQTDAERQAEALANARAEAETARADALRFEIAATKGVKPEDLDLLVGSSREDIEAKADRVIALYGEQGQPRPPQPNPLQGTGGNRSSTPSPRDAFAAYAAERRGG